jgi:hypothetical protein
MYVTALDWAEVGCGRERGKSPNPEVASSKIQRPQPSTTRGWRTQAPLTTASSDVSAQGAFGTRCHLVRASISAQG